MKLNTRITNQGYHLNVIELTAEQLKTIINELTIIPLRLDATEIEKELLKFIIYKYSKNRLEIIVPRFYGITKFGPSKKEFNAEEIDIQFTQKLRDKQIFICEKSIKHIKQYGGGVLSVPCGFGKTVCALYIAYRLGLKTLIIIHRSVLLKQWIKSVLEFLCIDTSRVGIIRSSRCDIKGKDIVIGMIQTISKRQYSNEFDNFGFVIHDEAHNVGCKLHSKTLLKTGSQYTLALTATPYRYDGTIKVMYWFLGGMIYREKIKINKNMIVKVIHHKSTDVKLFSNETRRFKGQQRVDTTKMITNICCINTRNKNIIDTITHIRRAYPARKIIVLSSRITQLEFLKKHVDKYINDDINAGLSDEIYTCLYISATRIRDRIIAEEKGDIIFATYEIASTGLDIKHLNTLIYASPKKDVMQASGRICRTILCAGDIRPLIIDYMDDIDVISNWYNIRKTIYTACKFEIEHYYLIDDTFKTYVEYEGGVNTKMHHPNSYIHNLINDAAIFDCEWNNLINIYNHLSNNYIKCIDNKQVLDTFEYTSIRDIYYTSVLNDSDIEIEVAGINDNIDETDYFNENNIMESISNKNYMPSKRLF